jgi:uroporphyrinogen-III synthase
VEAYRTVAPADLTARASAILRGRPDWITFTSSSTVENLVAAVGARAIEGVRTASIGPITSAALKKNNIAVSAEASVFTVDGLVEAILRAGIIGS